MTRKPVSAEDLLSVCATYGTPVLGTKDQEHFVAGFKHNRTFAEAKRHLAEAIEWIISEDEEPGRTMGPGIPSFQRDLLRREQRKRLAEWLGEES